jgi:uncharacterized protein with PhoU and TrkA domain
LNAHDLSVYIFRAVNAVVSRSQSGTLNTTQKRRSDMDTATLAAKARHHWATWLPEKTEYLKARGEWEEASQSAAKAAAAQIAQLMAIGYREHEAMEVAMKNHILLTPEPEPEDDWEARELAELEAAYQDKMSDHE